MIKQKHVDAAREVRLWLTYVILPAAMIYGSSPAIQDKVKEVRNSAKWKMEDIKYKIKTR